MKKAVIAAAAIMSWGFANAQAFEGKGDFKFQAGANIQDHASGITATCDMGIAENLSYGFSATYLLSTDKIDGEKGEFADRADIRARLNANIGNVINISPKLDVYPGLDLGLRNFGGHLGVRYFFTNGFGLYSEAGVPIASYDSDVKGFDHLNNQFVFQFGAAFNF